MAKKPKPLEIPRSVLEEVYIEARKAFPLECCGWIAGPRDGSVASTVRPCTNAQPSGAHPVAADRGSETAYVIAGEELLELSRGLDSDVPPLVIYHSHPNGRAYFSETDRLVASSPWGDGPAFPVQQLVVGIDEEKVVEAALFDWSNEEGGFIEIARYHGAPV